MLFSRGHRVGLHCRLAVHVLPRSKPLVSGDIPVRHFFDGEAAIETVADFRAVQPPDLADGLDRLVDGIDDEARNAVFEGRKRSLNLNRPAKS